MDTFDIAATSGNDNPPTMSSQEIADLLETRHDSVKRTIKRLAKKGVIQLPPMVEVSNHLGQGVEEYQVGKRDSYVVVAQLSPEFTARVVDRWQKLEGERLTAPAIDPAKLLNDPAALRGLLLENVEKVLALQAEVAAMTPKAEALARLAAADGSMCLTDAAKTLQHRPKDVIQKMRTGWIYSRQGGGYIAYQDKIQKGYLEHKTTTVSRQDGTEKVVTQVRVTPKGLVKLAEELGQH